MSRWGNEGFCNVQKNVKIEVPVVQLSQNNDPSANSEQIVTTKWETHNSIDQLKDCFHDNYEKTFGNELAFSFRLDIIAIAVLSMLFLVGIYIALKRKDSIKIK